MDGQSKKDLRISNQRHRSLLPTKPIYIFRCRRLDYTRSQLILRDASYHHAYILEFSGGYNEGNCCG